MESPFVLLRIVYGANVLVAGAVGALSLFAPKYAAGVVFQGAGEASPVSRIAGSFWLAIAVASAVGIFAPLRMSPVLAIRLLYKGTWLLAVALPALAAGGARPLPTGMSVFSLVWVAVLPWVLPYRYLFGR